MPRPQLQTVALRTRLSVFVCAESPAPDSQVFVQNNGWEWAPSGRKPGGERSFHRQFACPTMACSRPVCFYVRGICTSAKGHRRDLAAKLAEAGIRTIPATGRVGLLAPSAQKNDEPKPGSRGDERSARYCRWWPWMMSSVNRSSSVRSATTILSCREGRQSAYQRGQHGDLVPAAQQPERELKRDDLGSGPAAHCAISDEDPHR